MLPKSSIEEVTKTQSCLRDLELGRKRKCMLQEDHLQNHGSLQSASWVTAIMVGSNLELRGRSSQRKHVSFLHS